MCFTYYYTLHNSSVHMKIFFISKSEKIVQTRGSARSWFLRRLLVKKWFTNLWCPLLDFGWELDQYRLSILHRWRYIFTHTDFSVVESIPTNFEKTRKHLTWWCHRISFRTNSLGRVQCVPTFSLILLLLFSCLSLRYSNMSTYCSRIRVF